MTADHDRLIQVEADLRSLQAIITERFNARDRALGITALQLERAQAQANEWRAALSDLSRTKVDAETFAAKIDALDGQIVALREEVASTRGNQRGAFDNRSAFLSIGGLIIAALGVAVVVLIAISK